MTRWPLWSGQLAGNGARWNSDVCRALFVGGARPKRSIPRFPSRLGPLANCVKRRRGQAGDLLLSNGQMVSVNRLMQPSRGRDTALGECRELTFADTYTDTLASRERTTNRREATKGSQRQTHREPRW
jgi:hypothetical protein